MNPRVDIICLVHNNLPVTEGFVKHLFKNTSNFNLVFVDNGSVDKTANFLEKGRKENKWKVVSPGENLGIIKGRNLGAQHVTSEYFLNLDNDQFVQEKWLESLFSLMNKDYDLVGAEAWLLAPPKTSGSIVIHNKIIPDKSYFPQKMCTNIKDTFSYIGAGGCLIKKEVYDKIGLFDERYSPAYFEDPDLSFRAIQAGYKIGWAHNCKIKHLAHQTVHNQNLFNKNEQFIQSWMKFREKWFPYYPKPMRML